MPRKQMQLFQFDDPPATSRIKRAHMKDSGEGMPKFPFGARFQCHRCGWESPWWCFDNQSEIRRGVPCPNCNPIDPHPSLPDLLFRLKEEYFKDIKSGSKRDEYREIRPYWTTRIENKQFGRIVLRWGYKPGTRHDVVITRPWAGYRKETITHEHFGPDPIEVYAIRVN